YERDGGVRFYFLTSSDLPKTNILRGNIPEAIQDQPSVSRSASPQPPSWTIALARNLLNTIQPTSRLGFSEPASVGRTGALRTTQDALSVVHQPLTMRLGGP